MPDQSDRVKEVVLAAVKKYGCAHPWPLEHAEESLQKDEEVVLATVERDIWIQ